MCYLVVSLLDVTKNCITVFLISKVCQMPTSSTPKQNHTLTFISSLVFRKPDKFFELSRISKKITSQKYSGWLLLKFTLNCETFLLQVKLTGSHLVQQVYAMLPYMQSAQTHQLQEQTLNGRAKSKDKKKANTLGKVH